MNTVLNNVSGRQWPLYAVQDVSFANIADTGVVVSTVFKLPPNAIVIDGAIDVIVASDATTSTLNIGDSTTGNRYASAINLKSTGRTALTLTDFEDVSGLDMTLTPTTAGTATVGTFRIFVGYIVAGRATENQPN